MERCSQIEVSRAISIYPGNVLSVVLAVKSVAADMLLPALAHNAYLFALGNIYPNGDNSTNETNEGVASIAHRRISYSHSPAELL